MNIEHLLAPHDLGWFRREYWEVRPLHVAREDREHQRVVLTMDRVEALLAAAAAAPIADLRLQTVRRAEGISESFPLPPGGGERAVREAMVTAFASGFTLIANGLHHFDETVAGLCREVESAFGHPVGANLYMTPPGTVGLAPHQDPLESFLLQIEGTKTWRLWSPDVATDLGESPGETVELREGEMLYIPRGWFHTGSAGTETMSVHLSVQANPVRWVDLAVMQVTLAAEEDPSLRTSVPLELMTTPESRQELDRRTRELVGWAAGASGPEPAREFMTGLLAGRPRPIGGVFGDLDRLARLDTATELERIPGMWPLVGCAEGVATIHFSGSYVEAPASALDAFRFVAGVERFVVAELPGLDNDAQRTDLARALVREGMFRISPRS